MKKSLLIVAVLLGLSSSTFAQERVDLTTPETTPTNTGYRIGRVSFLIDDPATPSVDEGVLEINLVGVGKPDSTFNCFYTASTTPTGTFLTNAVQKANLSTAYAGNATTGSLKQRIYHRLVVMNEAPAVCGRSLVGTIAGAVP